MSTTGNFRPSRRSARQPHHADDALGRLLAAAAPPRDHEHVLHSEFRGEAEAVAAFRQARLSPAVTSRRRSMSVGKLFALKAAIAVVGLSGGGVALAAATGHLPAQLGGHSAVAASAASSAGSSATSPAGAPSSASASAARTGNAHPSAIPSPGLYGLCHAYDAGAGSDPGKALSSPAFTALVTAAGGKDKVTSYCSALLASSPSGHSGSNQHSHPTGKPSSLPTPGSGSNPGSGAAHSPGGPATTPANPATPHPTGKPSAHAGAGN